MRKALLVLLITVGACLAEAQTVTFLETGTDSTFDTKFYPLITGTVTSSTTSHTGPRSLSLDTGAGAAATEAETTATVLADSGTQVSFWFRYNTLPAANGPFVSAQQAGGRVWGVNLNTTGTITMVPTGATAVAGTSVLATGTWYRITVSYYITNTTTYQMRLYLNGVLEATANAGTLTRTSAITLRFIAAGGTIGANRVNLYDDVYVATGGASSSAQPDTGNILVTAKRPVANGTTNGFTTEIGAGPAPNGTGSGHAPNVSERALSVSFGWSILGAGVAITEEYNIQGQTVGDVSTAGTTIKGVVGWVYAAVAAGAETGQIELQGAATNIALTTTPTMYLKVGTATYPLGTGTDIGVITSTGVTTFSLYEAGVMVAYSYKSGDGLLLLEVGD